MKTYQKLIDRLKACGITPKSHILDNEVSAAYTKLIQTNGMDYQLVPPHMHQRNIAEQAIQTWKDHFVAILSGSDTSFPRNMWDLLLPQAKMTLNMLRQSNMTPTVSAYAHLYGPHDYNKHPLAPLGCAVQMHKKPNQQKTWAAHSIDGWYVGTSFEHYCTFCICTKSTKAEQISNTVFIKHRYLTNPTVTPKDAVVQAARDLMQALQNDVSPKDAHWVALQELVALFTKQANKTAAKSQAASPRVEKPAMAPAKKPWQQAPAPRVRIAANTPEPIITAEKPPTK